MWVGVTKKNIERLQKVQNFAVRIVTGARKFEHITPYWKNLSDPIFLFLFVGSFVIHSLLFRFYTYIIIGF